jgi:hypothetical protein
MTNKEALKEVKARIEDVNAVMYIVWGLLWGFVFGFIARGGAS